MAEFKKVFRGYNAGQVNEFLSALDIKNQSEKDTLKRKIGILEEEIRELNAKLEAAKDKENGIVKALLMIESMKDSAEKEIAKRSALEKERLEIFKKKWTDYAVSSCRRDYGGVLEVLDGYLSEYTEKVKNTINKGLDLVSEDTVLSREDEDSLKLTELCRKLGILED